MHFNMSGFEQSDFEERMTILLATSWPTAMPAASVGSPVNLYRALFSPLFQTKLPLLPDRSLVSTFDRPYTFLEWRNTAR